MKQLQKYLGKEVGKLVLIVGNAPTYRTEELLVRKNGHFTTNNISISLSVIETMRRHYRRQVLRKLLAEGEDEEGKEK